MPDGFDEIDETETPAPRYEEKVIPLSTPKKPRKPKMVALPPETVEVLGDMLWMGRKKPSLREQVEWVYENLWKQPKPQDSPSGGCWHFYKWAKKNEDEFYLNFWKPFIPTKALIEKTPVVDDDNPILGATLGKILQSKQEAEEEVEANRNGGNFN